MGGPATCQINLCFGWVNSWLEKLECFHIKPLHNSGKSFFIISMTLALECGLLTSFYCTIALLMNR